MNATQLDQFTEAYCEAALWSTSNLDYDGENDEPEFLDGKYGICDIAPETLAKIIADCQKFQAENAQWLTEDNLTQAGHDFWLTRQGHGSGFWDGDWPEDAGKAMTEASKRFGGVDLYPADGQIHS